MATIVPFIIGMGESTTLRSRQLGARDAETGWPAVTWNTSTIDVMVRKLGQTVRDTPAGRVTETRARLYTGSTVQLRDQVIYDGYYWEVEDVEFRHLLLGATGYYDCTIIRLQSV